MNTSSWAGKKVLIVDDSNMIRHVAKKIYSAFGLVIAGEAGTGGEALSMLEDGGIDLVHLDVIMPEMNGIDCLRKLIAQRYDVRVIVCSCLFDDAQVLERVRLEFPEEVAFVAKPFTEEVLDKTFSAWEGDLDEGMARKVA